MRIPASPFYRFAIALPLAVACIVAAVFYPLLREAEDHIRGEVRAAIEQEILALDARFHDHGLEALRLEVQARTRSSEDEDGIYLLLGRDGKRLAGNLPDWPEGIPAGDENWFRLRDRGGHYIEEKSSCCSAASACWSADARHWRLSQQHDQPHVVVGGTDHPGLGLAHLGLHGPPAWPPLDDGGGRTPHPGRRAERPAASGRRRGRTRRAGNAIQRSVRRDRATDRGDTASFQRPRSRHAPPPHRVAQRTRGSPRRYAAQPSAAPSPRSARHSDWRAAPHFAALLRLARLEAGAWQARGWNATLPKSPPTRSNSMPLAERQGRAVHVDSSATMVTADPTLLFQLLQNLLENALAHGRGDIELKVGARQGEACVDIHDHGPGVPEAALERIFERFYQVDAKPLRRIGQRHRAGAGQGDRRGPRRTGAGEQPRRPRRRGPTPLSVPGPAAA